MNAMTEMSNYRHEKVLFVNNEKAGLKAIIAVHNTNLGPAIGGCRLFPYASYDDALFDVLRLSRGMSHKNAVAGLPHGGGKGVIIADPSQKTEAMFEAFGEAVNNLGGDYITAEDVNTDCDDALIMMRKTKHICGLPMTSGGPAPDTKACPVCGGAFLPDGRTRYCSDACAHAARLKKQRGYMRKYRG